VTAGSGAATLQIASPSNPVKWPINPGNEAIASIIGSIAAGLECEFEGNVPVTPDLVAARLRELESASDFK
jgi:hypothetical protein